MAPMRHGLQELLHLPVQLLDGGFGEPEVLDSLDLSETVQCCTDLNNSFPEKHNYLLSPVPSWYSFNDI